MSWSSDGKRLYYGIGRVIVEVKLATTVVVPNWRNELREGMAANRK